MYHIKILSLCLYIERFWDSHDIDMLGMSNFKYIYIDKWQLYDV